MCPKNLKDLRIRKILIIGLNCLGDNLLLTPAIAKIRDTFKDAEFDIIIGPEGIAFANDHPWFSRKIVLDWRKSVFKFIGDANRTRYDLIINFRNSPLPFFLRGKYKMNFYWQDFLSEKSYTHESKRMLDFIAPYFGKEQNAQLCFPISKKDRDAVEIYLKDLGIKNSDILVVLNPAAGRGRKQWPSEKFSGMARELVKTYVDIKIILTGMQKDRETCERVKSDIENGAVFNMAGKTSLKELAALLEKADLLVTNDTDTLHLASAVHCPVVAIFGPTNPYRYGPVGTKNVVVYSNLDCFPCNEKRRCRRNYMCLEKISVEQVAKSAMLILDEKKQPHLFDL